MEINFLLLVVAALVGLITNAIWGFNPWSMIGAFSLLVLFFPVLGLAFEHDPQAAQVIANGMVERITASLPSLIIGEVAGSVAATIFKAAREIF